MPHSTSETTTSGLFDAPACVGRLASGSGYAFLGRGRGLRSVLVAAMSLSVLLVSEPAVATTALASAPLKGGGGGLNCACTNLTKDDVAVVIRLVDAGSSQSLGCNRTIGDGDAADCGILTSRAWLCQVARADGRGISVKQLACALSTVDSGGNVTAVLPVDKKLQQ
jgi:hypothetical protein